MFMCGIVGVVGTDKAVEFLIQGLEKLEYRGYDSAGIFVTDGQKKAHLIKTVGRIRSLKEKTNENIHGNIGIGHTRWATHGKPTEDNAHPHVSETGRFVLVHNGVLENFHEIKKEYLKGQHFQSDTDTEVAVHLIGTFVAEGVSVEEAFRAAIRLLKGSFAFAMIDRENPEVLYVAKNKSPLLVGLGETFNMIGSDAMAMIAETKNFMEIHDGEIVIVRKESVEIFDENGEKIERAPYVAELDLSEIGKGAYPYYMLKEIDEQPVVMRRLIEKYFINGTWKVDETILKTMARADRIYIVGAGTSYHAGFGSKALLEKLVKKPVDVMLASEFSYNTPILSEKPFFIFLTQSGETADSRQVLVKVKELGHPALTITNVAGSTLSREADFTLLLYAGAEIAVASTKAYTAQIAVMSILTKALGEFLDYNEAKNFNLVQELSLVATTIESVLAQKESIQEKAENLLLNTRNAFYIGRAQDYFTSMEAALKLKEISYIQCEGFAAGELKHGTISLIEESTPVLAVISQENVASHTRGNAMEVLSRGANVLMIVSSDLAREEDDIIIPAVHPLLASIVMVIPTQLIAYYATLQRGYDVDKPRNLAKAVTVE